MSNSGHFTAEEWADFVRQTAPADQSRAMQEHLASGCRNCTTAHDTWQRVAKSAASVERFDPPDSTLRIARSLFAMRPPSGRAARVMDAARALFDSALMPLPAGVRSAAEAPRKLVYAAGEYLVDLQVQPISQRAGATQLTGQVTMPGNAQAQFDGIPVVVLRHARIIAKTTTNSLGEFQTEFEGPADNVSIAFGFEGGGTVISLAHATRMPS